MIVNAIQAIEVKPSVDGKIDITVIRADQGELGGKIPSVASFKVKDNGVGFDDDNRDSFDTLYSDFKIEQGGKGFGRFTCLKYFSDLRVKSIYQAEEGFKLHRS